MNGDLPIEVEGLSKIYRSRFRGRDVKAVSGLTLRAKRGVKFG
jgi:hypothetical protein